MGSRFGIAGPYGIAKPYLASAAAGLLVLLYSGGVLAKEDNKSQEPVFLVI